MRKTVRVLLIAAIVLLILGLFVVRPWVAGPAQTPQAPASAAPK